MVFLFPLLKIWVFSTQNLSYTLKIRKFYLNIKAQDENAVFNLP